MNNYDFIQKRDRERHLLIVEGNHEKNELMQRLLYCFPEINIRPENIVIYGTNIYHLHERIVKEYGEEWTDTDVDLPYIVSKMNELEESWHKDNFINIFLFFDFERQDSNYSDNTIRALQDYFLDETDNGKLYVNYPMVESYWDSFDSPNDPFQFKKVNLPFKNGNAYKLQAGKSMIAQHVQFPDRLDDILNKEYGICDEQERNDLITQILNLNCCDTLQSQLQSILKGHIDNGTLQTAKYFLQDKILKMGYTERRITYFELMREEFREIIYLNIRKANMIQGGEYDIPEQDLKESFHSLKPMEILEKQTICSKDEQKGFIWVLNSSVFIVPDYAFTLIE